MMTATQLKRTRMVAVATVIGAMIWALLGVVAFATEDTRIIEAGAISDHGCDDTEWHFIINQIDADEPAPEFITVYWGETSVNVDLDEDGQKRHVAHYTTTANLDVAVTRATAEIYTEWSGKFRLSHGPCDSPDPDPEPDPFDVDVSMEIIPARECEVLPMVKFEVSVEGDGVAEDVTVVGPGSDTPYHSMSTVTEDNPLQSFFHPLASGTFYLMIDGDRKDSIVIEEAEPCPEEPTIEEFNACGVPSAFIIPDDENFNYLVSLSPGELPDTRPFHPGPHEVGKNGAEITVIADSVDGKWNQTWRFTLKGYTDCPDPDPTVTPTPDPEPEPTPSEPRENEPEPTSTPAEPTLDREVPPAEPAEAVEGDPTYTG